MLYSFQPAIPSSSRKGRLTAFRSTPFRDFQVFETSSANLQWLCFGCGHVEFMGVFREDEGGGKGEEVVVVRKRWSANRKLVCQSLPLMLYSQFSILCHQLFPTLICRRDFLASSAERLTTFSRLAQGVPAECGVGRHRRRLY